MGVHLACARAKQFLTDTPLGGGGGHNVVYQKTLKGGAKRGLDHSHPLPLALRGLGPTLLLGMTAIRPPRALCGGKVTVFDSEMSSTCFFRSVTTTNLLLPFCLSGYLHPLLNFTPFTHPAK